MSISAIAQGQPTTDDALKKITKYIPTEAVALYVAVAQFLDPLKPKQDGQGKELPLHRLDFGPRWILAGVFLVAVTPLMGWVVFRYRKWKNDKDGTPEKNPSSVQRRLSILVSVIAMAAWVAALSDTPALDWSWFKAGMGGVALLVVSFFLSYAAEPLGIDTFS